MCASTMCACSFTMAYFLFPAYFRSAFRSAFLRSGFPSCPARPHLITNLIILDANADRKIPNFTDSERLKTPKTDCALQKGIDKVHPV